MTNKQNDKMKQNSNSFWVSSIHDPSPHNANWQNFGIELYWSPHETHHKTTANGSIVIENTESVKEIFKFSYDPELLLRDKYITLLSVESAASKCHRLNMSDEDYEIIINEMGERLYRIL